MVKEHNIEDLSKNLKDIFCAENQRQKKYSKVWLTEESFGGLYGSEKYVVNVKADHNIDSCNDEIKFIIKDLFKSLPKDEFSMIWRVIVYNSSDEIHCESDDIVIYTTSKNQ